MKIVATHLEELAGEVARSFALDGVGTREVADVGRLLETLMVQSAVLLKCEFCPDLFTYSDASIFAAGTNEAFWTNTSFLMYSQVSGQPGPFYHRALLVQDFTSVDAFITYYHTNIWGKIFDIDVVMLGCFTKQLLIVTHYGAINLFEPAPSIS